MQFCTIQNRQKYLEIPICTVLAALSTHILSFEICRNLPAVEYLLHLKESV